MIDNILVQVAIAAPIVAAVTEAAKRAGNVQDRYVPLVSVVFGIVVFYLIGQWTWQMNILGGLLSGLTASGLYSQAKTVLLSGNSDGIE